MFKGYCNRDEAIVWIRMQQFFWPKKWDYLDPKGGIVEAQSHLQCLQSHLGCMHMHARVHTCAHMHARFGVHSLVPNLARLAVLCWGTPVGISACVHSNYRIVLLYSKGRSTGGQGPWTRLILAQKAKECWTRKLVVCACVHTVLVNLSVHASLPILTCCIYSSRY